MRRIQDGPGLMTLAVGSLCAVLLAGIGCGQERSAELGSALTGKGAIINGTTDDDHPYAGAIVVRNEEDTGWMQHCSGVMISGRVFLTAAHCLAPIAEGYYGDAAWGITLDRAIDDSSIVHTGLAKGHPDFDWLLATNDVGVVVLDNAIDVIPARLAVPGLLKALARGPVPTDIIDALVASQQEYGLPEDYLNAFYESRLLPPIRIEVVGYGVTDLDTRLAGTRMVGRLQMHYLSPFNLHLKAAPSSMCSGDSGGPAMISHSRTVVGVGSWSDGRCDQINVYSTVDDPGNRSFIDGVLKDSAPPHHHRR